jgi:hypothetical protein
MKTDKELYRQLRVSPIARLTFLRHPTLRWPPVWPAWTEGSTVRSSGTQERYPHHHQPSDGKANPHPQHARIVRGSISAAAVVLKPGGRLVFANPLRIEPLDPSLKLEYQQVIDLGGFDWHLKMYLKLGW